MESYDKRNIKYVYEVKQIRDYKSRVVGIFANENDAKTCQERYIGYDSKSQVVKLIVTGKHT
jgi:hypothetical protein